jgi:hypothetical protein
MMKDLRGAITEATPIIFAGRSALCPYDGNDERNAPTLEVVAYSKSLLPMLHFEQSVSKFSNRVSPPFAQAILWST